MLNKIFLSSFEDVYSLCKHPLSRIFGFILLGVLSRLLPHPPNVTAMNAIALFGVSSLGSLRLPLLTTFSPTILSNLVFGFDLSLVFVYVSFGLIVLLGYGLKSNRSLARTTFLLVTSCLLFFLISNFGVWLVCSMYPKTIAGLGLCYLAAIPFLVNNLIGTLLYGWILFNVFHNDLAHLSSQEQKRTLISSKNESLGSVQ